MKIIVFGATGGTGRAVIKQALAAGHEVTAFVRDRRKLNEETGLKIIEGDAMVLGHVNAAVQGQEAIVVSLGNSQNAFGLLLGARRTTPRTICETGTRNILDSLSEGLHLPMVVISAFGVGDTRDKLPFMFKLFYRLFLREQIADKERQDALLNASKANFVMIQPAALTDAPATGKWTASRDGSLGKSEVSRSDLADFIVSELEHPQHTRQTITFSGALGK